MGKKIVIILVVLILVLFIIAIVIGVSANNEKGEFKVPEGNPVNTLGRLLTKPLENERMGSNCAAVIKPSCDIRITEGGGGRRLGVKVGTGPVKVFFQEDGESEPKAQPKINPGKCTQLTIGSKAGTLKLRCQAESCSAQVSPTIECD